MNLRKMTETALADLAANVAVLLAGTELDAIEPALRTELISALGTLPADLDAETGKALVAETERMTFVSSRDAMYQATLTWMGRVRDALRSGLASKEQFAACGLTFRAPRSGQYVAIDPTNVSVAGYSNGVNTGRFDGNNKYGRVTYEIWRRHGDDGQWMIHMLTTTQKFVDNTGVVPGQYYEYKVRAVAAQTESNYSNSAVVYGVL
jgi:hypothetical protein